MFTSLQFLNLILVICNEDAVELSGIAALMTLTTVVVVVVVVVVVAFEVSADVSAISDIGVSGFGDP